MQLIFEFILSYSFNVFEFYFEKKILFQYFSKCEMDIFDGKKSDIFSKFFQFFYELNAFFIESDG